ncbi:MAG: phosphatidylserine decarboxylase [Deltaproteobacteria bacterium]|nr:phosphatidylserine decarboxylase [Deltaproteobacteria bacterium]
MSVRDKAFVATMHILPKKPLSRTVRRLASLRAPSVVRRFAARYGASVEEAELPIESYGSVLEFFTRRLKPGARPIAEDPDALVCPVDGAFLAAGVVATGRLYQAKGREFTLNALLADEGAETFFRAGSYAIVYLAPGDYHRIHAPVSGQITGSTYIPGTLFPVNEASMNGVDALLARNERLITHIDAGPLGRVDVVMVGATCVGHMIACYDPDVKTNAGATAIARRQYDEPKPIERGAELGVFEMGSTVVLVTERPIAWPTRDARSTVRMGTELGRFTP